MRNTTGSDGSAPAKARKESTIRKQEAGTGNHRATSIEKITCRIVSSYLLEGRDLCPIVSTLAPSAKVSGAVWTVARRLPAITTGFSSNAISVQWSCIPAIHEQFILAPNWASFAAATGRATG